VQNLIVVQRRAPGGWEGKKGAGIRDPKTAEKGKKTASTRTTALAKAMAQKRGRNRKIEELNVRNGRAWKKRGKEFPIVTLNCPSGNSDNKRWEKGEKDGEGFEKDGFRNNTGSRGRELRKSAGGRWWGGRGAKAPEVFFGATRDFLKVLKRGRKVPLCNDPGL